jgi:twitching motility two-component system response regulator PilH
VSTTPTVAFIDDSATMREVIKIAFRRENIDVITYPDAVSALEQLEQNAPDVVITDVIMPDKDGYEVCQHIKKHPKLGKVPVILMSGVVNRAVADKAFSVKADELIRKPFQPQDLITRVRHLLQPNKPAQPASPVDAAAALSSIFGAQGGRARPTAPASAATQAAVAPVAPIAIPASTVPAITRPQPAIPPPATAPAGAAPARPAAAPGTGTSDVQKLKVEIARLEGLVRKLQSELAAEREYTKSLEEHMKTLQDA